VHELIYRSRATAPFDRAEIGRILATARRVNAEHAVTGLLLYSDQSFLQVLEGDEADVRATFARIEDDPRHTDLAVLVDAPIERRAHPEWTMGFHHLDGEPGEVGVDLDAAGARALIALHAPQAVG
jgi:hypothetical protein